MVSTGQRLHRAAREAIPIIDRTARLGFAAKGIVAIVIGAVAVRFALGYGADLAGPKDALVRLLAQPFGWITLAVVSLGLWAHALWKLVQAIADPERKGTSFTGLIERGAFGVTAVGYVMLAMTGTQLLFGDPAGRAESIGKLVTGFLMPPVGRWVISLAGLIAVIAGILQMRLAVTAGFRHVLLRNRMSRLAEVVTVSLGRAGYAALGVVSAVIGYLLIRVAQLPVPSETGGWSDALAFLAQLEYGRWLLGLTAVGLLSYGLFFVFLVRYRETF